MHQMNILITSAGRRVELMNIWRKTLESMGLNGRVLATDLSRAAAAFQVADAAFQSPACRDPEFVPYLIDLCRKEDVHLVVPTIDTELPFLADARQQFDEFGCTVHVSSPETIAVAYDKRRTHGWLSEQGFPTPFQLELTDIPNLAAAPPLPVIVKPVHGSSSVGLRYVTDVRELEQLASQNKDCVVQTIAPGVEFTVDVLVNRQGRCLSAVPRRRLEVRTGEVSKGMTVSNSAVIELASRVAEALPGAWGVLNIQIFHDAASGELNVIEVNPRFGGGFPLTWEAEALLPKWLLEEVLGRPSTAHPRFRDGLVMLRYDAAVFRTRELCGL